MCQISRQSDIAVTFYSSFCKCAKRGRKIRRKKTKKLGQFLKSHISGTLEAISLKFGVWNAEGGGSVHSKNRLVSSRQHRATKIAFSFFLSIYLRVLRAVGSILRNGTERNDGLNCGTECFLRLKLAAYQCCTSYQWHFQQVIKRTPRKIKRI